MKLKFSFASLLPVFALAGVASADCDGRGFLDIPAGEGAPIGQVDDDWGLSTLAWSVSMSKHTGIGATRPLSQHEDITFVKWMDRASANIYVADNGTSSPGCDVYTPSSPVKQVSPKAYFLISSTVDGEEDDGTIVIVDANGNVVGRYPKKEKVKLQKNTVILYQPTLSPVSTLTATGLETKSEDRMTEEFSVDFTTPEEFKK